MDSNENAIKDERERRIEENRLCLMQSIKQKEEKEKEKEEARKQSSPLFRFKHLISSMKNKVTDVSSLGLTDFPVEEETVPEPKTGEGDIPVSPDTGDETEPDKTSGNADLQAVLDNISGRYAIVAFTCLEEVDTESLLKTGLTVLSTGIYPIGKLYVAVLSDCWQNKNALNKLMDDLVSEFKKETGKDLITVCLGAAEDDVNARLKRTINALNRKIRDLTIPTDNYDLSALQHRLKEQIEANAIEQARRQLERQLEEDGEIDEDLPVVIREAKNMSEDEYDSYLSEEEQEIKCNARKNYIDDDVSIEQTLHNIEKHNTLDDPLYLIAIASVDMNTLIILEDADDFEELCEEADVTMMRCSYIYAISKSGGHWYGNNHATRDIEDIFETMAEIIRSRGGRFRSEFLYEIPNISIFKGYLPAIIHPNRCDRLTFAPKWV